MPKKNANPAPRYGEQFLRHEINGLHASLPAAIPPSLCSHTWCSKPSILTSLHLANQGLSTYSNEILEVEWIFSPKYCWFWKIVLVLEFNLISWAKCQICGILKTLGLYLFSFKHMVLRCILKSFLNKGKQTLWLDI